MTEPTLTPSNKAKEAAENTFYANNLAPEIIDGMKDQIIQELQDNQSLSPDEVEQAFKMIIAKSEEVHG